MLVKQIKTLPRLLSIRANICSLDADKYRVLQAGQEVQVDDEAAQQLINRRYVVEVRETTNG
jgi:hypothetical protein